MLPNFMPASSNAPSFPINAPNMNMSSQQPHPAQRMQPPSNASTPTPGARTSPFGGMPLNTPPNNPAAQSQFSTPQNTNQAHLQTPNNQQSQVGNHGGTILTPQTPNFPPGTNAGSTIASPLSPGSQTREKERVSLLLDINTELLMEVMHLQVLQKKDPQTDFNAPPENAGAEKEKADKLKGEVTADYLE